MAFDSLEPQRKKSYLQIFVCTPHEAHLPIYVKWTLLPELFGPVHFQFKGGSGQFFIITMFY